MPAPDPLVAKVEGLQNLLVFHATGGGRGEDGDYEQLRRELMNNPLTGPGLPRFVHTCRDLSQFWQFIKYKYRTYAERREYLWDEFRPLIDLVEARANAPLTPSDDQVLSRLSPEAVQTVWQRALERRISDPEGAITSARGLLETVCKHILEDLSVRYDDAGDLPKLYRLTSESLNIAPSQHTAQVFKQILGGCTSVVEGLASLRNRLGDAHGGGRSQVRPAPRHAQLAVNLAGSMTSFLVATWEARKNAAT
jgi:hypothetical protein